MDEDLPAGHTVRRTDHLGPPEAGADTWRSFGIAVLAFHHRVAMTAMCRCGRTTVECDVLAHARAHNLIT